MTANPWWFSGNDSDPPAPDEPQPTDAGLPNVDWTAITSGAQRLLDWATERVMAPHADHADPHDHPQCLVCRTLVLLADRSRTQARDDSHAERDTDITWIPFNEESGNEESGAASDEP